MTTHVMSLCNVTRDAQELIQCYYNQKLVTVKSQLDTTYIDLIVRVTLQISAAYVGP